MWSTDTVNPIYYDLKLNKKLYLPHETVQVSRLFRSKYPIKKESQSYENQASGPAPHPTVSALF